MPARQAAQIYSTACESPSMPESGMGTHQNASGIDNYSPEDMVRLDGEVADGSNGAGGPGEVVGVLLHLAERRSALPH